MKPSASTAQHAIDRLPFRRANELRIEDVVTWLGLMDGDVVRCPGCGEADGSASCSSTTASALARAVRAEGKPAGSALRSTSSSRPTTSAPSTPSSSSPNGSGSTRVLATGGMTARRTGARAPPGRFDDEPSSVPEESGTEPEPERDDRSRIVWAAEMAVEDPPIPWVCEVFTSRLGARPSCRRRGTAKSMLAAHFANCVGTGRKFLKRYSPFGSGALGRLRAGRSLTKKRQQRFARAEGWRLGRLQRSARLPYKPFFLDSTKRLDGSASSSMGSGSLSSTARADLRRR